jgi:plastocyanin
MRKAVAAIAGVSAIATAFAMAAPAPEGPRAVVKGQVKVTQKGAPKPDMSGVVVYVVGFEEPAPDTQVTLGQRNKAFEPPVMAVTAGQNVSFPNHDSFFHNVFSLSPARPFDLGQYRQGEAKVKQFPKAGVVDVYCNIHPQMAATLLVLPNRRFAVTDKTGRFEIQGVPAGNWTVFVYDRFAAAPVKQPLAVAGNVAVELSLAIDEVRTDMPHVNKFGQPYPKDDGSYK